MGTKDLAPILAALQAVLEADETVTAEEEAWLKAAIQGLGLEVPSSYQLEVEELRQALPTRRDRVDLIRLMLSASLADGVRDPREVQLIEKIGALLDLSATDVADIQASTRASRPG
ncbi:MAG: TerB family tellurite resistance protein [Armatimonadetes bacterium]|nr:TerB family tellurite resistance protein [Armatimonadota bacterium]